MKSLYSLVFIVALTINSFAQLPGNLRAYFSLNNTWNDSAGISTPAVNYGAIKIPDRNGKTDFAVAFNGLGSYINMGTDLSFGTTTIAFWVKPGNLSQVEVIMSNLFNMNQSTSTQYEVRINANYRIDFFLGNVNSGSFQSYVSVNPVSKVKWTHVVAEIENNCTGYKLYLNGALDSQVGISGITYTKCTNPFVLGARSNPNTENPYSGSLDEIMIFNKALTATEVLQVYSLTNGINKNIQCHEITLFPNPTKSEIQINAEDEILLIKIIDLKGQLVLTETNFVGDNKTHTINIADINQGIYYMIVETKAGIKTEKLIKL